MNHIQTILFIAGLTFCSSSILAEEQRVASTDHRSEYVVKVLEQDPMRVYVEARIETSGDTLYMNSNCPNYDYPEGWASFVENLSISTPAGDPVSCRYQTKSKWILGGRPSGVIDVRYEINLAFTRLKWDVGNEQAGFSDGKATYLVSKAVFIYPEEDGRIRVRTELPSGWKLSTPWKSQNHMRFTVPDREHLIENSVVFGEYYAAGLEEGGFDFRMALLGAAGESAQLFSSVLTRVVRAYVDLFRKTPPDIHLVTVFYADLDDGESFRNSNTFTLRAGIDDDSKIIWANQMAHELFHYWNSHLILADSYGERQWFSEGTAEYYANITLLRAGIIDEPLFRSKMEKVLGLYYNFRGWRERETSLRAAGDQKGRNRFLVYNGGWAVAMALDVIIMEESGGGRSLDDWMRLLFDRYSTRPYRYKDLVQTASEVAGRDLNGFFLKYVEGVELIPLEEYMAKLGYRMLGTVYEAEIYLVPATEESPLRKRWLRSPRG